MYDAESYIMLLQMQELERTFQPSCEMVYRLENELRKWSLEELVRKYENSWTFLKIRLLFNLCSEFLNNKHKHTHISYTMWCAVRYQMVYISILGV